MFTRAFFTFFPPPNFLRMPAVGLDVSDEAVRFVEFVQGRHGLELGRYGQKPLPPGAVESGYIKDSATVTALLKGLKKEYDLNCIRTALPEEKAYLFKIEIPKVSHKEIRAAIELRLEENVPLAPAQAIFDYEIGKENNEQGTMEVSVSVLPEKVITTYLDVFTQAGLTPVGFEMEGRAMSKAFIRDGDHGTYIIANLAERKTGVFIVSDGVVRFTSTLYAINSLSTLKDELAKVSIYWSTHGEKNKKIDRVILCGENPDMANVSAYLAPRLKIAVEQGNPWINAFSFDDYIPGIDALKSLSFGVPIGLALSLSKNHV